MEYLPGPRTAAAAKSKTQRPSVIYGKDVSTSLLNKAGKAIDVHGALRRQHSKGHERQRTLPYVATVHGVIRRIRCTFGSAYYLALLVQFSGAASNSAL